MLKEIKLKNFKCFKDEIIVPVDELNLFAGFNGRGKSTALQSLLCIRQSCEKSMTTDRLFFNGSCMELGSLEDVKNIDTPRTEDIVLGFDFESEEGYFVIKYFFGEDENDDLSAPIKKIEVEGKRKDKSFELSITNLERRASFEGKDTKEPFYNLFVDPKRSEDPILKYIASSLNRLTRIHYISADRVGPRDYYPRESFADFVNVGSRGQFTVDVLARKGDKAVQDPLRLEEAGADIVLEQTSAWLERIFSGGKVYIKPIDANIISMRMNSDGSTNRFKPINVGFGYSYTLPIVVSGLIAEKGDILIVENPEAHLVPSAQSTIADFLFRVSRVGVQVFIESHSEHILNGLRIAVLKQPSAHKSTNIIIFHGDKEYSITRIPVTEKGQLETWPDGFFDQAEIDFEQLHGI